MATLALINDMADYTVVNLKRVEDMAPKFGYSPQLESRFARVPLQLEQSGLSYFRVAPDFRLPFGHTHGEQAPNTENKDVEMDPGWWTD